MLKQDKYYVTLSDYEHGIIVRSLNDTKTELVKEGKFADDVNDLLIKVGTAPKKKFKVIDKSRDDESR